MCVSTYVGSGPFENPSQGIDPFPESSHAVTRPGRVTPDLSTHLT